MEKVKESIVTIEDMFNEEFEKYEKMLADSLEDFRKNGCENEDVDAEILMATCEGKLEAFAQVAKELLGDNSLEEKFESAMEKYEDDAIKILHEMGEIDAKDYREFWEKFDKAFEEGMLKSES